VAGLKPDIAWPNDLLVEGRKLAGILCETQGRAVILGCGLNVNQTEFPPELTEATSLRLLLNREFDRFALLGTAADHLGQAIDRLAAGETAGLLADVRSRMTMLGHEVRAEVAVFGSPLLPARAVTGTARELDAAGRLVLALADGRALPLNTGTTRRIR
jgi:BirA family biotin operon repressor/biotin-[acetyl-CoA-carboxylase] ligase